MHRGSLAAGFEEQHSQAFRDSVPDLTRDDLIETCRVLAFTYDLLLKVVNDCKTDEADSRWNKKLQEYVAKPWDSTDDFIFGASDSQAGILKLLDSLAPQ